ncbi:MAG: hypothetical protein ACE5J3_00215 [Methanosarcinales archaeon]
MDLEVYAPKEKAREIHKFATKITYDIQLEEGYNIVVLVIPYILQEDVRRYIIQIFVRALSLRKKKVKRSMNDVKNCNTCKLAVNSI